MTESAGRRIDVFFYGLFMDVDALRVKGLHPFNVRSARVRGMGPRIGSRAALIVHPAHSTYGVLMELTHAELDRLYSEPGVADYRPEAVTAELSDGSRVAALCFNLPAAPPSGERSPDYALKLSQLAARLGFPVEYVDSLRQS